MTAHPAIRSAAVQLLIRKLSMDRKPILVGPWRSEVGFEALYWRPFLARLASKVPDFWQRAIVVTRGGAANLYGHYKEGFAPANPVAPDGQVIAVAKAPHVAEWWQPASVDLYTLRTVAQIRQQNLKDASQTGLQKQTRITAYDRQLLRDAADVAKVTGYHVLHPSWMYWALAPFWDEARGLRYLFDLTDFAPLAKPLPPVHIDDLPTQYVAVKFYGRATWPHPHPVTSEFVAQVIETIAKQVPVLVLNTGHDGDEHTEMCIAGPNIFTLPTLAPAVNLGVQLALLGRAQAFIGTYGGVAQAALRMGVPSASFWVQFGGTAHAHLSLSSWLSKRGNVPFVTGGVGDAGMWRQLFIAPEPAGQPLVAA